MPGWRDKGVRLGNWGRVAMSGVLSVNVGGREGRWLVVLPVVGMRLGLRLENLHLAKFAVPKADVKPTAEEPPAVEGAVESMAMEGAFMPISIFPSSSSLCREPPLWRMVSRCRRRRHLYSA